MLDSDLLAPTDKIPIPDRAAYLARRRQSVSKISTAHLPAGSQVTLGSSQKLQEAIVSRGTFQLEDVVLTSVSMTKSVGVEAVTMTQVAAGRSAKKSKWVGLVLRLAVTLALFFFLLKSISLSQIWSVFLHLDPAIALVGLVIGLYTLIVSGYQWQCLLRGERIGIDLTRLVNLYMVGIAFNHFLPTSMGGDVVKIYYVARESKNMSGSASAAIMARITGFFGMLLVAYPALLIWHASFSSQVVTLFLSLSGLVLLMVSATFCLALLFTRLARSRRLLRLTTLLLPGFLREKLIHSKILSKGIDIGNTLLVSAKKPLPMIGSIIFGVMFHVVACLNYFSFSIALHMSVPLSFYLVAIPFVSLVAFLPISVNGFGLRESTMVFVFAVAHVSAATALLLAFVIDIQMLFFGLIGICLYLVMGEQQRRESKKILS